MKKVKKPCLLFCLALAVALSACGKEEGLKGTYKSVDDNNDSLWFEYASKVQVNLDGEILEGTYRVSDNTILITIDDSQRLIVLTRVDDALLMQYNGLQVFRKR